jgi:hypothetical protein
MPKVNYNNKKEPKPTVDGEDKLLYCRKCTQIKKFVNFYEATSFLDTNGKMSICKDCCNDIYNYFYKQYNYIEKALYETCRILDVSYSIEAMNSTLSHIEKLKQNNNKHDKVFGYYKSKISSMTKINGRADLSFANSDNFENNNSSNKTDIEFKDENFIITSDIVKFWGKGKETWEYEFLDEEMYKIKSSFECPDYGMEMLMRDICFINLDIEKNRQGISKNDVDKLMKTRGTLMNDAKMKPIQASGAEANEQVSFGTLIKKLENERPIPQKLGDEMKKYIDTFMSGHLAKMLGLNCDLVDKYEESLKEYTIDFEELDNREDDE